MTIKILYCGMCHTDLHHARNDWGITMYPVVPGCVPHPPLPTPPPQHRRRRRRLLVFRQDPCFGTVMTVHTKHIAIYTTQEPLWCGGGG